MASENDDMGLAMSSISMFNKSSNTSDPFFSTGWDPIVSQSESLGGSSMASHYHLVMENQGISGTSHVSQYQSNPSFVELVPKLTGFDGGNLSQMPGPFSLPQCNQIANRRCPPNFAPDEHRISEVLVGTSPNGKIRKRSLESDALLRSCKNGDEESGMDLSSEGCHGPREQAGKKPKTEQNSGATSRGKQTAKQNIDNSQSGETPKENFIHVRARRGQATNSHSLAERLRREKISERMRLLQELVPGCNKITGKAVMLDEIINYVQSLQQQVEFLSMKLATVNPELSLDLDRILSKDVLHPQSAAVPGFGLGTSSSHAFSPNTLPRIISGIPNTNPGFPPLPQTVLENEVQNLFQMGFYPGSTMDGFGLDGRLKPEM
ncbi:hypothetical protein V6N13_048034 [Hibiscus sabdariffa]